MTEYEAGPELDALVAERIMGAQLIDYTWYDGTRNPFLWWPDDPPPRGDDFQRLPNGWRCEWNSIPPYSTGVAAAWAIIDHLNHLPSPWRVQLTQLGYPPAAWRCEMFPAIVSAGVEARAKTLPLAICRAVLLVL